MQRRPEGETGRGRGRSTESAAGRSRERILRSWLGRDRRLAARPVGGPLPV